MSPGYLDISGGFTYTCPLERLDVYKRQILIYMLSSRMRETVPDWRLTAGERAEILYRWTFASVRDCLLYTSRCV